MLKKLGIPLLGLLGMLTFATPKPAEARVHFGVAVGAPPVYPYYQYCSPYDPYCSPYAYSPYVYGYPYGYTYTQPYFYGGWGHGWGREYRGGHEHHEFRGHGGGGDHHR